MAGIWDSIKRAFGGGGTPREPAPGVDYPEPTQTVGSERALELIEEADLDRLKGDLKELLRPGIELHLTTADEADLDVGASKIGGRPDLPAGVAWPRWNEAPLSHIVQIRLSDVAPYDIEGVLPKVGMLHFFYDARQESWGFDPADRGSWQVLHYEAEEGLTRAEPPGDFPDDYGDFGACALEFSRIALLPGYDSIEIQRLELTNAEGDALIELNESMGLAGEAERSWLLGCLDNIQSDPREEGQMAAEGLYAGDQTGYQDPRAPEVLAAAGQWRLLLQVCSESEAGMMWGDAGMLYFLIRDEDLKRGDFSRTWMVLQCY